MHSLAITGTACLHNSTATPSSPRKSNLTTDSLIICPFSSRCIISVPLNNFERKRDNDISSSTFISLKNGIAEISFAKARIGPGIPVPPVTPAVLLDPATSLTRWKNHVIVPIKIFCGTSFPMKGLLFSGTSTTRNTPLTSVPYDFSVNCVNKENAKPTIVGW